MTAAPSAIKLHRRTQTLELQFADASFNLPAEYLRVFSPSAEVRGHGVGQEVLQFGKKDVAITDIQSQGNYAIRLVFSDGHNSGIFTWEYLHQLGTNQIDNWQSYLQQLHNAGKHREADVSVVKLIDP